jgi:hypothetical protein
MVVLVAFDPKWSGIETCATARYEQCRTAPENTASAKQWHTHESPTSCAGPLRVLVGIEILAIEKPVPPFHKKGEEILAVHSPAMLFAGDEKPVGKTYSFKAFGVMREGRPSFYHIEAQENKSPKKERRPTTSPAREAGRRRALCRPSWQ